MVNRTVALIIRKKALRTEKYKRYINILLLFIIERPVNFDDLTD